MPLHKGFLWKHCGDVKIITHKFVKIMDMRKKTASTTQGPKVSSCQWQCLFLRLLIDIEKHLLAPQVYLIYTEEWKTGEFWCTVCCPTMSSENKFRWFSARSLIFIIKVCCCIDDPCACVLSHTVFAITQIHFVQL